MSEVKKGRKRIIRNTHLGNLAYTYYELNFGAIQVIWKLLLGA